MDTALISALAAVMGSLVGGSATIATAWITQKTQSRRDLLNAELQKRESLYTEFITECSKLAIDALDHTLEDPEKVFVVYALQNRIRLKSTAPVVEAADHTITRILEQYFGPNLTRDQLKELALSRPADPLRPFSEACRQELEDLRRGAG
jgi:hypothetical protein